jgi:phosphate transport system substrate-binding protein
MKYRLALVLAIFFAASAAFGLSLEMDLAPYNKVAGVSGRVKSVGSDTLHQEMQLWARGFQEKYPEASIEIEGAGSNTAPPALLSGEAQLGPMSRQMTPDELDAFQAKYGFKPTAVLVAIDALAIYVNKDNPIQCLTMEQIERIFAADPKSGGGKSIFTWGDVGATGPWATRPIALYGRNTLSGTYKFFRQNALGGGDFKPSLRQEKGSEAVVASVEADAGAIGYSGIGYKTVGVRAISVSTPGKSCSEPNFENAYSRKYPLARGLYIYVMKNPASPLEPMIGEFIKYILSRDGQSLAAAGHYYPVTNKIRNHELTRLGLLVQ